MLRSTIDTFALAIGRWTLLLAKSYARDKATGVTSAVTLIAAKNQKLIAIRGPCRFFRLREIKVQNAFVRPTGPDQRRSASQNTSIHVLADAHGTSSEPTASRAKCIAVIGP